MFPKRGHVEFITVVIAISLAAVIGWFAWSNYVQRNIVRESSTVERSKEPTVPVTQESVIADTNRKLGRYAVQVTLTPPSDSAATWSQLTTNKTDVEALRQFAEYLVIEFTKYPTDLVKNSNLQTIGIVRDLKVSGTSRPSLPAPKLNAMVYDAVQEVNGGKDYASSGISHEYWHYLDYKIMSDYRYADSEWSACNPSGFTYGDGGEKAYGNPNFKNAFYDRKGFVTEYSTYGIEEDRAEMFAWLMYDPDRVKELNDDGITCKTKRLTTIVRQLSPEFSF